MADTNVLKVCKYNADKSFKRKCLPDLEIGPQWNEPDLNECEAKSIITQQLESISEVRERVGDYSEIDDSQSKIYSIETTGL